jgi:hypothetical protein
MFRISAALVAISAGGVLLWRVSSLGAGELATHSSLDRATVVSAISHLRMAQQRSDMKAVSTCIADAVHDLGVGHFASTMLANAESEARNDVDKLHQGVSRVIESLTFRPWMEAEVPEGFPEFTPVHHIEVKTLPEYRMARATMVATQQPGENGAFWKLFSHIKRNNIAMTAPVQMDYTGSAENAEVASMAFLYGSLRIGASGSAAAENGVEIVDIPEQEVVCIGVRGQMKGDAVETAHRALLKWLASHDSEFRVSGPLRRMGYNSPFIPSDRAFFEVQIPVQRLTDSARPGSRP